MLKSREVERGLPRIASILIIGQTLQSCQVVLKNYYLSILDNVEVYLEFLFNSFPLWLTHAIMQSSFPIGLYIAAQIKATYGLQFPYRKFCTLSVTQQLRASISSQLCSKSLLSNSDSHLEHGSYLWFFSYYWLIVYLSAYFGGELAIPSSKCNHESRWNIWIKAQWHRYICAKWYFLSR